MAPPPSRTYDKSHDAAVLFFMTDTDPPEPAIRFIAYRSGWELTDGNYIGPDPAGIFHFDNGIFDNVVEDGTKAKFRIEKFDNDDKQCLRINFFKPGSTTDQFGEFVAFDKHDRAGQSGMLDETREATWKEQDYASVVVSIKKSKKDPEIKITNARQAVIDTSDDLSDYSIDVRANLTAKNIDNIGDYVRWHKDRAVFYEDEDPNTTDFTSFLFPDDDDKAISSKDNLEWWVTWE